MSSLAPVILLNDTRVDRHHGCSRVMAALDALLLKNGCITLASAPAHSDWRTNPSVYNAAKKARLVIVNGEGTLHHDRSAGLLLLEAGAWARSLGIPAVLVNAGWEANGPSMLSKLRDFAQVIVRDSRSGAQLRSAGISCRIVPDLSLYLPAPERAQRRRGVAFTDSVQRPVSVALDAARRKTGSKWVPIQAAGGGAMEALRFLREGLTRKDLAVPATGWAMTRARIGLLRERSRDPDEFLRKLSSLGLLVTGRFHACALGLLTRTPFLAVPSNTAKIEALIEDADLDASRVVADLTPGRISEALEAGWKAHERAAIDSFIAHARTSAEAAFADIRRLA